MNRIKQAEKKDKSLILILLGSFCLIGLVLLFLFYNKSIIMVIFLFCITILVLFVFLKQFRAYINGQFLLTDIIEKEPQRIVWVYSILTQRMPFGFQVNQSGSMYFKMIDGEEIILTLPATELKSVSEMLNSKLPHATFGFTKEREQWYMAHPELLVRREE